jgi:hypothetical protein
MERTGGTGDVLIKRSAGSGALIQQLGTGFKSWVGDSPVKQGASTAIGGVAYGNNPSSGTYYCTHFDIAPTSLADDASLVLSRIPGTVESGRMLIHATLGTGAAASTITHKQSFQSHFMVHDVSGSANTYTTTSSDFGILLYGGNDAIVEVDLAAVGSSELVDLKLKNISGATKYIGARVFLEWFS